jgi:hypothetical protein
VKGLPADDDGYEWSLRLAKRSCLALAGLVAFFWLAGIALQFLPSAPYKETPTVALVIALLVALAVSVVTGASFVRERIARVGIGEYLARERAFRRPRAVYATFATATTSGVLLAHVPALCGFIATALTRSLIPLAIGTVVTGAAWGVLWPRRELWDRWTWQARVRRDDDVPTAPFSKASAG